MKIIAVINQKGGVGKSTTADALGSGLIERGKRVLYVDVDGQGNLSFLLGADPYAPGASEVLRQKADIPDVVQHTERGDVLAGSIALADADITITETGREYRLRKALKKVADDYDYVIIDTPPSLGITTVNALTAADGVVIPAQADILSMSGILQLNNTIDTVAEYTNPNIKKYGILLTRYTPRTIVAQGVTSKAHEIAKSIGTKVFDSKVRECAAIKEAQIKKSSIFAFAPKSNASEDYHEFINEFIGTADE